MRLLALLRLAGGLESAPISRRVASSNNSGFFIMGRPVFGIRQMKRFMTNLVPGLRRDFHSRFKRDKTGTVRCRFRCTSEQLSP